MSDIDDDLLALAGGEEDELSDEQPEILKKRSKTGRNNAGMKKSKVSGSDDEGDIDVDDDFNEAGDLRGDDPGGSGDEDLAELALGTRRKSSGSDQKRRKSRTSDIDGDLDMNNNDGLEDEDDDNDNDMQAIGDEMDVDEDDEVFQAQFANPYPLEGKYKDAADRERLESLPEIERESILFDRSQEIESYNQKLYLAQHARQRRLAEKKLKQESEKATRSKREKSSAASTKANKLSELKKKREEKHSREKAGKASLYKNRKHGSDEEDDDEYYDEDEDDEDEDGSRGRGRGSQKRKRGGYDDDDDEFIENDEDEAVEWAEPKKSREITVSDINKIRFGRTLFSKYCHNPGFQDVVIGTFVRVNIGFDREKQRSVYRICEVKNLHKSKTYSFQNRTVDETIVVASGKNERSFEMGICSDSPFTEDEFRWWKQHLLADKLPLPSVKSVERKMKDLVTFKNHVLTDTEVRDIVERRQKLTANNGVGVSRVLQKSALQERRQVAVENGDTRLIEEIDRQLAKFENNVNKSDHSETRNLGKLAAVNARNRRANVSGVRQAELKNVESRRKAGKTGATSDPFSRLRTNAKIFHEDFEAASENGAKQSQQENKDDEDSLKKSKLASKAAYNAIDDKIANIPFQLEIEI